MRKPAGMSFLLIGSGLYWILSSHLISSFTVLLPELFQFNASGQMLTTIVGIVSVVAGLWSVNTDVDEFRSLADGPWGYVYVLPVVFVAFDILSTLVALSANSGTTELNPFVSSAIEYGFAALAPFLVSYLTLSQGLAILMLRTGRWLFGESNWMRVLPFAIVSGISSFGPLSNSIGMAVGFEGWTAYVLAAVASAALVFGITRVLKTAIALRTIRIL